MKHLPGMSEPIGDDELDPVRYEEYLRILAFLDEVMTPEYIEQRLAEITGRARRAAGWPW